MRSEPPPWGPRRALWVDSGAQAPGQLAAGAHHTVGIAAVVVHAVLHQLLLVQVAGATVRAGEG